MFINFFYELKREGVPVSLTEWLTLMEALAKGLSFSSLTGFYYLARSILVKSEAHYDRYDAAFLKCFKGVETTDDILNKALEWFKNPMTSKIVSPVKAAGINHWDISALQQQLADRLQTQNDKHLGGPKRVGSGGTSAFGNSGYNPAGVRVGGSTSGLSAVKVAAKRNYREYRNDQITGVRQFEMALRKLRLLSTKVEGPKSEIDIGATIDATCKNAGFLKLVWERPRRNTLKIILLMDSGGSMDRFYQLCSRLFTAANRTTHFKELKFYYFHNCVYDYVYTRPFMEKKYAVKIEDFLRSHNSDYRLIIVGDASMGPNELTAAGEAIEWAERNEIPGIVWLKRLARHFTYSVWLNPVPVKYWGRKPDFVTIEPVREIFPMYELTPEGLEQAIKRLKVKIN